MTGIARAWWRWRTREARFVLRSRWLWRVTAERRHRAERALLAEPKLTSELVQILGHHEDLDRHFVQGFTARPDPISPQKRLSDGFAAMALRCERLRVEAFARRQLELRCSAGRAASKSSPEETIMGVSER